VVWLRHWLAERRHKREIAKALKKQMAAAYTSGCLTCVHNKADNEADFDNCELGSDWEAGSGCPYWRWKGI
jgi:hypothetical protein